MVHPVSQNEGGLVMKFDTDLHRHRVEFVAEVDYGNLSYEGLKQRFPDYVNPDFEESESELIACCKEISLIKRDVGFTYIHLDQYVDRQAVLELMERARLRPPVFQELLGFAAACPEQQKRFPITGFGTVFKVRGSSKAPCLWGSETSRHLTLDPVDVTFGRIWRFLAVVCD